MCVFCHVYMRFSPKYMTIFLETRIYLHTKKPIYMPYKQTCVYIRRFPTVSPRSGGVGRTRYEISLPHLESLRNIMRFTWSQITGILLVSRTSPWHIVQNLESFSNRYTTISDAELDELIREIRRGFPNSGISMMAGHMRRRNVFVQLERVRSSLARIDSVGWSLRWFNSIGRRVYSVRGSNSFWHIDGLQCLIRWRFVIHGGINFVFFFVFFVFILISMNTYTNKTKKNKKYKKKEIIIIVIK